MTPEIPIPLDEPHRFLNWQPTRGHCQAWAHHFASLWVSYVIADRSPIWGGQRWTIYKHHYSSEKGQPGQWCCPEADA